jgi:hypothetical protein
MILPSKMREYRKNGFTRPNDVPGHARTRNEQHSHELFVGRGIDRCVDKGPGPEHLRYNQCARLLVFQLEIMLGMNVDAQFNTSSEEQGLQTILVLCTESARYPRYLRKSTQSHS